ncbi:hypothetical protein [Bacillus clarus]|nr:hypothetical protein [Bacillus clarus]
MSEMRQADISETFSRNEAHTKGQGANNMKRKKSWKNKGFWCKNHLIEA